MSRRKFSQQTRGTTLVEILVAVALLLIIFLFVTANLLQSSRAENISATRTEAITAANYLLGVMRTDKKFWSKDHWASGLSGNDPCGNPWPPYTDSITNPTWHPAPACTPNAASQGLFPDLAGLASPNSFQYMWNAQPQGADPDAAQLTVWVQIAENGINLYELHSTMTNIHPPVKEIGVLPTPTAAVPTVCPLPCASSSPVTPPPGSPKPKPPTPRPSPTIRPTPIPSGTFE